MSTGVPSGSMPASRVISVLSMRMQPWVTLVPSTDASLLPWMPVSPSPPSNDVGVSARKPLRTARRSGRGYFFFGGNDEAYAEPSFTHFSS